MSHSLSLQEERDLLLEIVLGAIGDRGDRVTLGSVELLRWSDNPDLRAPKDDPDQVVCIHRHVIPLAWTEGTTKRTGTIPDVLAWARDKGWLEDDAPFDENEQETERTAP